MIFQTTEWEPKDPYAVTWGGGTDEEVGAMLDAAHQGKINLADYWSIGDERVIRVSAFKGGISQSGNTQTFSEQDIVIVISSFDEYMNCGNVMQFDFKNPLTSYVCMYPSATTSGGYGGTKVYSGTLPALANALPSWLKNRLITFSCLASAGGNSSTINTVTNNKLALRSEVEVMGSPQKSFSGEGSQIPYYNTPANRIKALYASGTMVPWWERSPIVIGTGYCIINSQGGPEGSNPVNNEYVAPFGCI